VDAAAVTGGKEVDAAAATGGKESADMISQ
jgi:hypothetical protein